jgi:uncharacterized protein
MQQLNEKLESLYKRDGAQFLIMIFPSLQGEEVLEYTNRVANMWKVKEDKALMLFVFVKERKTWIQVGYGLEPFITDAYASRVYRNTLVPYFQKGQYAAGLNAAVDELASKIDPNFAATGTTTATATAVQRPVQRPVGRSTGPSGTDVIFLVILFLVFLFVILPLLRRGGCGGCSGCLLPMFWGGGGGTTFGGGGFGGGGGGWSTGGSWGSGSSFGGGGAGGSW